MDKTPATSRTLVRNLMQERRRKKVGLSSQSKWVKAVKSPKTNPALQSPEPKPEMPEIHRKRFTAACFAHGFLLLEKTCSSNLPTAMHGLQRTLTERSCKLVCSMVSMKIRCDLSGSITNASRYLIMQWPQSMGILSAAKAWMNVH